MSRHFWTLEEKRAYEEGQKDARYGRCSTYKYDRYSHREIDKAYFQGCEDQRKEEERIREERQREEDKREAQYRAEIERQRRERKEEEYWEEQRRKEREIEIIQNDAKNNNKKK